MKENLKKMIKAKEGITGTGNKGATFNEQEWDAMITAIAYGQGEFHEDDVMKLRNWIITANINFAFAEMVLKGELAVDTRGKEFSFRKMSEIKKV